MFRLGVARRVYKAFIKVSQRILHATPHSASKATPPLVHTEYERTKVMVLRLMGQTTLLEKNPVLAVRFDYRYEPGEGRRGFESIEFLSKIPQLNRKFRCDCG